MHSPLQKAPARRHETGVHRLVGIREATARARTRAVVDLTAVVENMDAVCRRVGAATGTLAVLKADAYGHGLVPVARALERFTDVSGVVVTSVADGLTLRAEGFALPVILMAAAYGEDHEAILAAGLTPVLTSITDILPFARAAIMVGRAEVHVKIDTGMGRLGLRESQVGAFLDHVSCRENRLLIAGLCTHLSSADGADSTVTEQQLATFERVRRRFAAAGHRPSVVHASNTAATYRHPASHFTHVRTGIALFGGDEPSGVQLRPALTVVSEVVQLRSLAVGDPVSYGATWRAARPSVVATLPLGYSSGYPRRLVAQAEVLVRGVRCPVIGAVCMEMMMVDVTDVPGVTNGTEVVVIGAQHADVIRADALAAHAGTIVEELFCSLSQRLPREYLSPRS